MMKKKEEKTEIKKGDKVKKKKNKKNIDIKNGENNDEKSRLQKYMDELWGFSSSEDDEKKHEKINITDLEKEKECTDNDPILKNKLYENSDTKGNDLLTKFGKEKNNINMHSSEEEEDEHTEWNSDERINNNLLFGSVNLKNNKSNQVEKSKKKVTFDKTAEVKKDSICSNKSDSFYKNQGGKKNKFENASISKMRMDAEVKQKDKLSREKEYKEKREMKKTFMDAVHEIRKLTLPHLNKFQRKNVENHQIKLLGGKFDKSQKVHYPELMQRKKSIKKYISKRKETEKILGVKLQTGDSIDMHDVFRKKNKNKKFKKKNNLF
ncbi:conserved Plasmodium protein, unknown function [Plasmodium chabaudi chabaudi]|uniref:Uncharacterized protein n=1 Tax=Plasmodium chabaudi chabaudi TaxID=31271 RepID=A0A1D3LJN5_PLACU|nr:conserved Plasmodium protein, unknown function [Plasmodium chabaudi chabaudi]